MAEMFAAVGASRKSGPALSGPRGVGLDSRCDIIRLPGHALAFSQQVGVVEILGIGLERHRSGNGPEQLQVPKLAHRLLKSTILGAALSAVLQGDNPFAEQ